MHRLILLLLLAATPAFAGDWPQFRGPQGSGASDEKDLPIKWSSSENIRWKAELPGRAVCGPVVAKGRVYVTAASGFQETRLHVVSFDAVTGKRLWQRQIAATGNTLCHQKTSVAAPTPATDGDRVFALFATGDLVGFDRDGNLLWVRSLAKEFPTFANNVGAAASPVISQDTVLIVMQNSGESFALGIDAATGKNRWKVERKVGINWVSPVVRTQAGVAEVLFQSSGELTAYDVRTGQKRWSYEASGLSDIPSPTLAGDVVLVHGGEMAAIRPGDGRTPPQVVWKAPKLKSPGYPSPVFYRDHFYNVNGAGVVTCVDAKGETVWQSQRLKGPFAASPVAADGKLYLLNEAGQTFVLKLGDKPELLATNELGEPALGTPALADGAIFIRTDKGLFCIGEKK